MKKIISALTLLFIWTPAAFALESHPVYTALAELDAYLHANNFRQAERINTQANDGLKKANAWSENAILAHFGFGFKDGKQTDCKLEYISAIRQQEVATAICPEEKNTVDIVPLENKEGIAGINYYIEIGMRELVKTIETDTNFRALVGSQLLGDVKTAQIDIHIDVYQNRAGIGVWTATFKDIVSGKTIRLTTAVNKYLSRFSF